MEPPSLVSSSEQATHEHAAHQPRGLHRSPAFSQAAVVEQPTKTTYIGAERRRRRRQDRRPTVGEQASQAFRNQATILESEGASLANIVHWTIAVADGHAFDEGSAAIQEAWNPSRPTAGHHGPRRRRPGPPVARRDRRCRRRLTPRGRATLREPRIVVRRSEQNSRGLTAAGWLAATGAPGCWRCCWWRSCRWSGSSPSAASYAPTPGTIMTRALPGRNDVP